MYMYMYVKKYLYLLETGVKHNKSINIPKVIDPITINHITCYIPWSYCR